MKRLIIFFFICLGMSTYTFAYPDTNDSLKLETINSTIIKELEKFGAFANNRSDYGSKSFMKTIITTANKLNKLSNDYYSISNDSSVYICSFIGEFYTALVYEFNNQTDSAYVHSLNALQLYEPYGRMFLDTDTTQQMSKTFFGDSGIMGIIRDWHIEHNNLDEALKYNTFIADSCRALNADIEVVKSFLKEGEIYKILNNYKNSIESQIRAFDMRLSCANYCESPLASQIYVGILNTIEELIEKVQFQKNKESLEWIISDDFSFLNNFVSSHPFDFCDEEEKNGETFWVMSLYEKYISFGKKFKLYDSLFSLEVGYNDFIIRNFGKESTELAECLRIYSEIYNNYSNEVDTDLEKEKFKNISNEKENQALETWKSFFEKNPINLIAVEYQKLEKEFALQNEKKKETSDEIIRLNNILHSYSMYMLQVYTSSLKTNNYEIAYDAISKVIHLEEKVFKITDASLYQFLGLVSFMRNDYINAEKSFNQAHSLACEKKDTLNMAESNLCLFRLYEYPLNNKLIARQKLSEAYKLVTEYSYHSINKSRVLENMADYYKSIYNDVIAYRLICLSQIEKQYCGQALTDEDYMKEADFLFGKDLINDTVLFCHIQEIADKNIVSKDVQKASELLGTAYTASLIDFEKGIHYLKKAVNIAHELKDSISEAKNTAEIGTILFASKKYDDALTYMQKAEKINTHLKFEILLPLLAHISHDSLVKIRLPFLFDDTKKRLRKNMLLTNSEGREMLVRLMPYDVLKSMIYYYPNLSICADISYNSTLLYKGLLQNTHKTVSEYIASSNDYNLKEQFKRLQIARSKEELEESTIENSTQSQMEILELEMSILEKLSKKKMLADLDITWNKVCNKLGKDDVAIEFVEINKQEAFDRSAFCYGALILRRGYIHPVFVVLDFKDKIDKEIDALLKVFSSGSHLTTTKWKTVSEHLYKEIWEKLEDYIHPGENVYFSTDGLLHKTPIEFLSDSLGYYANEKYNMYRLSSTRELCKKRKEGMAKAILYGGLLYDADAKGQEVDSFESFQPYDKSSKRSGWNYLPASEAEVDSISSLLSSNGITIIKRKGLDGTEESFKELSGLDLSIVHIATHGFYFPQKEVRYLDYFQSQNDISPMKRSGLMMTGGQTAWTGKKNLDQEHDGILTSEEISKIDLSNVGLVVLSACQTGLGDIDSGAEGVIGIQRAFKLAGAQSLLMSLWKVDDEATSYMMRKFYSSMLSGDTKHNAFKLAQKEVRNKYPNPYYWAGFVMLD